MATDEISAWSLKRDLVISGFTGIAFALGIKRLVTKKFIHTFKRIDYYGEEYDALALNEAAWDWIEKNEAALYPQK